MISVELEGAQAMIARLIGIRDRIQNPEPALIKSAIVVRDAAVQRIKDQGGDEAWTPSKKTQAQSFTLAQTPTRLGKDGKRHRIRKNGKLLAAGDTVDLGGGGHTGIDTGAMWQSIGISEGLSDQGQSVDVGTNLKYARWFQQGSGIFADHSEWTIHPKKGKALRWTVGGVPFFARSVTIPGQPQRPFLVIRAAQKEQILAIMRRYIMEGQ